MSENKQNQYVWEWTKPVCLRINKTSMSENLYILVLFILRHTGFVYSQTYLFCLFWDILVLFILRHTGFVYSQTYWFCLFSDILVLFILRHTGSYWFILVLSNANVVAICVLCIWFCSRIFFFFFKLYTFSLKYYQELVIMYQEFAIYSHKI
jgi:hypothetical protein